MLVNVMMSEDMEVSCTQTNWETSGSPGRGVQLSEAPLGLNNLSIISANCLQRLSKAEE